MSARRWASATLRPDGEVGSTEDVEPFLKSVGQFTLPLERQVRRADN